MLTVAIAQPPDDDAIRYVLPVLSMFAPIGRLVTPRSGECTRPPWALWRHYALQ